MEEFPSNVPDNTRFSVGYFERNSTKRWLIKQEDLVAMYDTCTLEDGKEICLWCDGIEEEKESGEVATKRRKKDDKSPLSRREEKENSVDETFQELKEKHGDSYTIPLLRLWARVIIAGHHESPPALPQFKKKKTASNNTSNLTTTTTEVNTSRPMSPGKTAEVRSKYMEQLQQVKVLHDEGVLNTEEYEEQKSIILVSLRKLK